MTTQIALLFILTLGIFAGSVSAQEDSGRPLSATLTGAALAGFIA